jgi:hypothetical protein
VLGVTVEFLVTGADEAGTTFAERELLNNYRRLDDDDRREIVGIIALKLERYQQKGASVSESVSADVSMLGMAG